VLWSAVNEQNLARQPPNPPGGSYWWNRATGETTNLGEPRPVGAGPAADGPLGGDGPPEGAAAASAAAAGAAAAAAAAPAQRDNTYGMAFAGIALGVCVGWWTQYMP
jgi:hypothetical protein